MKARTKAARRRAAGRREPNGRLSRRKADTTQRQAATEANAMETAVQARIRVFGISEADAKRQEGGTVVGRMLQNKDLSPDAKQAMDMYRAAERYAEVRNAYQRAIGISPDTGTPPRSETSSDGDYASFCATARKTHAGMMGALQALCQTHRSPNPISALDQFITRDVYVPHLVGDFRLALNCLHRHFAQGEKRRAA